MNQTYEEQGYLLKRALFTEDEMRDARHAVLKFHESWTTQNQTFYQQRAINSAYLTDTTHLADDDRLALFRLIGSNKLMKVAESIFHDEFGFLNTQLFFNPMNPEQKNYWHRDTQYGQTIEQQKAALSGPMALHFRIALHDEPGVELVPYSHRRWDSDLELDVRLEQNGHKHFENLPDGKVIQLNAGDLLVFSASMIHRGLYGLDRLALDVLFCDPEPNILQNAKADCMPTTDMLQELENPGAFYCTQNVIGVSR